MQLMAQCLFTNNELGCIRTIETIDTIRPRYSILHSRLTHFVISILKEASFLQDVVGDELQNPYHILSAPMNVRCEAGNRETNVFAARLISKALYKIFLSSGSDWFRNINAF
jgi:hypothetical protein